TWWSASSSATARAAHASTPSATPDCVDRGVGPGRTGRGARARGAGARASGWERVLGRSVVGGELLGEERERSEQEQAHHDQREVFVHRPLVGSPGALGAASGR